MVRIRLRRVGSRHQPSYRIVAADSESPRDGRYLEILGHFNPRTQPATLDIQEDRVYHWMGVGAKMSEAVEGIFKNAGVIDRFQRMKAGEELEVLLAESKAYFEKQQIDPRTRRDDLVK